MSAKSIIKRKIEELGYEFEGCCRVPIDQKPISENRKKIVTEKMNLLSTLLNEIEGEENGLA